MPVNDYINGFVDYPYEDSSTPMNTKKARAPLDAHVRYRIFVDCFKDDSLLIKMSAKCGF